MKVDLTAVCLFGILMLSAIAMSRLAPDMVKEVLVLGALLINSSGGPKRNAGAPGEANPASSSDK